MSDIIDEEIQQAAHILSKVEPGKLPLPIFLEVARLTVTPILEVVPIRIMNGKVEVLLIERDVSDPIWGGKLHTPGTVIRASDNENYFADAFGRILNELANASIKGEPAFVNRVLHQVKRGRELAEIYYVEIDGESNEGKFYASDSLPAETVETQIMFIEQAVEKFKSDRQLL
jgi:hypothetical protein